MIPLAWSTVVELALGELRGDPPPGGVVTRVHADSRTAGPGDLFVALNTGVRYVDDALARGAATLVPYDQHRALAMLAGLVRDRSGASVVAVVGSAGKTSTKDALGALCAAVTATVFAETSQNNEIGLPLTVLRLEPDTQVLVTEMGMRGPGQIAALCSVARPDMTVVTSIGPEHLELVGGVADVAAANAEAIAALPPGGTAVVPAGEPLLDPFLERGDIEVRRFDRRTVTCAGSATRWRYELAGGVVELDLPYDQRHLAENVLAALTAYEALGLPLDQAHVGAGRIAPSPWRGTVTPLPGGGTVVDDAYNANPVSMRAALTDLAGRAVGRRTVAVLGTMAELGDESDRYHREIADLLGELGVDVVVGVGDDAAAYLASSVPSKHPVGSAGEALELLASLLRPGDVVLVKASRAVALEGIAPGIEKIASAW